MYLHFSLLAVAQLLHLKRVLWFARCIIFLLIFFSFTLLGESVAESPLSFSEVLSQNVSRLCLYSLSKLFALVRISLASLHVCLAAASRAE